MSEKDQENFSQDESSDADDLDSLSSEEKAAFEKIMAEISIATGETPEPEPSPTPPEPVAEASPPEDTSPPADERIGTNQETGDGTSADKNIEATDQDPDTLSDDQQEALDKIMAEIGSKRKSEKAETPSATESQSDDDSLSDDQQDALNQIMAEIESKRNSDRSESTEPAQPQTDDEPLAEEQQEALNKIMADIQAKRNRPEMSRPLSDEDIETPAEIAENQEDQDEGSDSENLTLDEFDSELSNLLSSNTDPDPELPESQTLSEARPLSNAGVTDTVQQPAQLQAGSQSDLVTAQAAKADAPDKPVEVDEPVLHEVIVDTQPPPTKNVFRKIVEQKILRRIMFGAAIVLAALCLCVMALGGYFSYSMIKQWRQPGGSASPLKALFPMDPAAHSEPEFNPQPTDAIELNQVQSNTEMESEGTPVPWLPDLINARKRIQNRISEIQSLKEYYRNGIDEDVRKITALVSHRRPTLAEAMSNKNIELAVRAVQRRSTYILKLEVPLKALDAFSEEILFLERQVQLYDTLSQGISGLPKTGLKTQITKALDNLRQYSKELTIDDIQVVAPDMEMTWQDIVSRITRETQRISKQTPLNKTISAEICNGNYERKFMLTALSAETAQCLINWAGKDMNLNELTELSAETARILIQWPGEWLSLNGLKTLSAETAKILAQWPGKRLSLNGLSILSPDTTANLSQWDGDQLEMIGLQSIGSWENYGTRLFLSESLRRRLDIQ